MFKIQILLAFAALSSSISVSLGQNGDEVSLQILSFPVVSDPKPVELVTGKGESVLVETPCNNLSVSYKVPRMSSWVFGKSDVGADGKPVFKIYGQAPSLPNPKQILLLVRKGDKDEDGLDVLPIANDVKNFGAGVFLFMNAAKVDIAGMIEETKFVINPGKHVIVKPPFHAAEDRQLSQVSFYYNKNGKPKAFFSSTWPIDKHSRGMIFFYHDPETQRLKMHSIRNFIK